jgi:transmembrane sensor
MFNMDQPSFEELIDRYICGDLSDTDRVLLAQLINEPQYDAFLEKVALDTLGSELAADSSVAGEKIKAEILSFLDERIMGSAADRKIRPFRPFWRYAAAAVILIALAGGWLLWKKAAPATPAPVAVRPAQPNDVAPGHEGAILTLADGKQIDLDSSHAGTLATQGNTSIDQRGAGQLIYNAAKTTADAVLYNTLTTPRGRRTSVVLSDGTKVWLNAASSIKFPTVFTGPERSVEVTGEAYFDVAKNPSMPFTVKMLNSDHPFEIRVLGTSFNTMAYGDEPNAAVTLVNGSIRIVEGTDNPTGTVNATSLTPGQQRVIGKDARLVADADIAEATAWKENQFLFKGEDLPSIMKQLARWYDIEVRYEKNINDHYTGKISRDVNISKVLKMLEAAGGVTFSVQGKVVKVLPKPE